MSVTQLVSAARIADFEQRLAECVDASLDRYVDFLQRLLRIPTPRMREHAAVRFLGEALAAARTPITYFEGEGVGELTPDGPPLNLFAVRKGSGGGKSLLLEAHIDTVPAGDETRWSASPWSGRIENGRIYARGAHDDRSGTAMMWMIADLFAQLEVITQGDVYFLVTSEEEYGDGGMRAYMKRPDRVYPDAHLALDGNQRHFCIVAHAGALTFEVRIAGAWGSLFHRKPDQATNPIELAALFIAALREFEADYRRRTRELSPDPRWPEPMIVASDIRSASWFSNTPEDCRIGIFANVIPPMTLDSCKKLVTEFVESFAREHPWLREHPPSIRCGPLEIPAMVTAESSDFYQMLAACHQVYFDAPLRPRYLGGWGDMVLLGCPNLIFYGPGAGGGDHSYDEYFELADLAPMLKAVGALTLRWAGVRK
jgi:acetylornithine deacetylase